MNLEPADPEDDDIVRVVSNDLNYKLLLWVNGEKTAARLFSEVLEEGVNCKIGFSIITISYIDSVTGA